MKTNNDTWTEHGHAGKPCSPPDAVRGFKSCRLNKAEWIYLAGGSKVPKKAVDALSHFEEVWPGATFPLARPGIVKVVIDALKE